MSEKSDAEWEKLREMIKQHAQQLGEHFETVQILATRPDSIDGECFTQRWDVGVGNHYARFGQATLWLEEQAEFIRARAHQRIEEQDDDEET